MARFEYVHFVVSGTTESQLGLAYMDFLNARGAEGWQLVNVNWTKPQQSYTEYPNPNYMVGITLMREIQDAGKA